MGEAAATRFRFSIHGQCVELTCQAPEILEAIHHALGEFAIPAPASAGLGAISGSIRPYDAEEVVKHLSATATRVAGTSELLEIYEQDERFWRVDDRWGICELNLIKGQFRSWILDRTAAIRNKNTIVDNAVMWPLSQLLRPRGLSLVSAAAVVREGWGAMVLSPFSIEPELRVLTRAGWKLVGQSWTAIREERGNIVMLPMPGSLERSTTMSMGGVTFKQAPRVDLAAEFFGCRAERAGLDAILLVAPGRRPLPDLRAVMPGNALAALRRDWPIAELHPHRRHGQLMARIAQRTPVFDIQLSRNARDMLAIVELARQYRPPTPRVTIHVNTHARQAA